MDARHSQSLDIKRTKTTPKPLLDDFTSYKVNVHAPLSGRDAACPCAAALSAALKALSNPSKGQAPAAFLLISQIPAMPQPGNLTAEAPQGYRLPPPLPTPYTSYQSNSIAIFSTCVEEEKIFQQITCPAQIYKEEEEGSPKVQRPVRSSSPLASPPCFTSNLRNRCLLNHS